MGDDSMGHLWAVAGARHQARFLSLDDQSQRLPPTPGKGGQGPFVASCRVMGKGEMEEGKEQLGARAGRRRNTDLAEIGGFSHLHWFVFMGKLIPYELQETILLRSQGLLKKPPNF